MLSLLRSAAVLVATLASIADAVTPAIVKGQDFVDSKTGKRLMIIGVDYQPGGQAGFQPDGNDDPLTDAVACLRDATLLQRLGVNTIRVYNLHPSGNHDECASIFNAAGIYMVLDVNTPFISLERDKPAQTYHVGLMQNIFATIEAFKDYPNTLAFFSANEVVNDEDTGKANPPYIRAIQRDMKAYIVKHASRSIPVGYSAADVRDFLVDTYNYLRCTIKGDTENTTSDFFALNSYSWCGRDATYSTSGYDVLTTMFSNSSSPVFFSEYGCNTFAGADQSRPFDEVQALYGKDMTALSGGLVYEWTQEANNFGLVIVNDNNTVSLRKDFNNLQDQYNKIDLTLAQNADPTATAATPPVCSAGLIKDSGFSSNFTIPDQPDGVANLIKNGIKSPNNGKLVKVTTTKVASTVYASDNVTVITGLELNILGDDQSNLPNGQSTTANSTTTGAQPSATKKGDAGRLQAAMGGLLVVAFTCLLML